MVSDFDKKQKGKLSSGRLMLQLGGIFFFVLAIVLVYADYRIYQKKQELAVQVQDYKSQIQDMQKNNKNLKNEIANSDNSDYIEKIAREEEDMQKPGEKVVSFIMPKDQQKEVKSPENFWSTNYWFGWIGQSWNWLSKKK